ncbi:MAG: hypothetical protein OXP69_18680 [Spirochaetaceae bacterium]|nr:hypothetical protein [Spirochaetaceae bacterium]
MQQVACGVLFALAGVALASCGAGPGAAHPDLVVEDPAVSDRSPAAGKPFTFSATVRNAGRGNAAATMLRVYRSDDATITTSDQEVDTVTVAELAASASRIASETVTAPSSPGTYYYGACVGPVARESDTGNNCSAAIQVTVPEVEVTKPESPRPDLVVEDSAVSAPRPTAGARFTFRATVRNAGRGSAAATTLRVYRSDDATITPDDKPVATDTVPELAASKRSPASAKLSAPASAGTYYYGACVDPVAGESATANNCSEAVRVTVHAPQVPAQVPVSGPPRPDMVVNRFWVNTSSPAIGGIFKLWADVRNRGGGLAYTILRFYRSTDATVTRSDTELVTEWVARLRNDSDDRWGYESATVKVPSRKGTYYYGACVDVVAGESATTNNCSAAVKVEVSHDKPDLTVTAWGVSARSAGASLSVGTRVNNRGSPSDATTLRLLLLPDQNSEPSAGTQVGQVDVPELVVTSNSAAALVRSVEFQLPATAGLYYYVMCVDAVPRESDTGNNCSTVTKIEVR